MAELTTFFFTDIEGSTPLWDAHRQTMQGSVLRHEELLFAAVAEHGGRVVKTMGDGLYAVFDTAADGVAAAIAGQRALMSEPWPDVTPIKVRMGLHTGAAEARGGDFYGPTVNKAARVMGIAHGGQIVATTETVGEAGGDGFVELGEIQLRGVREPASIHQVLADGLPDTFPPVKGLDIPSNLPAGRTTFVGRESELADVADLLRTDDVVTLLGFGGSGKTRLAVEAAAASAAHYPDGVWFVDLAPVTDDDIVATTTAEVLDVTLHPGRDPADAMREALDGSSTLIVLDNCEQVIGGAAKLVHTITEETKSVTVLATSRTPLGIDGETIYEVEPLATDLDGPAVQVFVDRARAANRRFMVDDDELAVIRAIVGRLDGIPLAIELAAARVRMLSPAEILERLDDRFALLTGGARTAEPRQQTLRGLVEWSVDLLNDVERDLFECLSVFAEDFTVDAAAAMWDGDAFDAFDLLANLIDHSLIRRTDADDELRFGMLETLKAYAADRVGEGQRAGRLRARHADHFFRRTETADERLKGGENEIWRRRFGAEEADLLRAQEWLCRNDPRRALHMAAELDRFWYWRGAVSIGARTTEEALEAAPDERSEARALALAWLGFFYDLERRRPDARLLIGEALEIGRAVGSARAVAQALNNLGAFANDEGRLSEAVEHWSEAVEVLDAAGSEWVTAPLFNLGYGLVELGELQRAAPIVERLTAEGRARGDEWTESVGGLLSAYVAFGEGDLVEGQRLAGEVGERFGALEAVFHQAEVHILRAAIAELSGDVGLAEAQMAAARAVVPDSQIFEQAEALVLEARIAFASNDQQEACRLLRRAIDDERAEPNHGTVGRIAHEVARLVAAAGDIDTARRMAAISSGVFGEGGITPTSFIRDEAETLGGTTDPAESGAESSDVRHALDEAAAAVDALRGSEAPNAMRTTEGPDSVTS